MKKILLTSSSGGHYEQLMVLKKLLKDRYDIYVVTEKTKYSSEINNQFYIKQISRKDFFWPFKYLHNVFLSKKIFDEINPDIVVSCGVLATIPLCKIAKKNNKKLIYIESFAKINSPTKTGKYIYKLADDFIVQWPEMLKFYPKAHYFGGIY